MIELHGHIDNTIPLTGELVTIDRSGSLPGEDLLQGQVVAEVVYASELGTIVKLTGYVSGGE